MKKVVTFGEIMLRCATQPGTRLKQATQFSVHYGGAEANVAVSMANFGYPTYFVSKVPNNPFGNAVEAHLKSQGVHTDLFLKGGERLGTYYVETGVGERSSQVVYDRKYSSFSQLQPTELDVDSMLKDASILHVTGITPALSINLREIVLMLVKKARELGVLVSFDFNYRAKLWHAQEAGETIRQLLPFVDICFCGELDVIHLLGFKQLKASIPPKERLVDYYKQLTTMFPNIWYVGSTFRTVQSASANLLQGNLFFNGELSQSKVHQIEPIIERVGGGDAFAAGILYGILEGLEKEQTVSFATAASALKHTIYGDHNDFTKEEVWQFIETDAGKIVR